METNETLFVPYCGESPASVEVNGHRFLILSRSRHNLEGGLGLMGADHLEEVSAHDAAREDQIINSLARKISGGVVLATEDQSVDELINNLEMQLPWLQ